MIPQNFISVVTTLCVVTRMRGNALAVRKCPVQVIQSPRRSSIGEGEDGNEVRAIQEIHPFERI
jgi:hypothetical protein